MGAMMMLGGLVGGMIFGLLVAWGTVGLLVAGIGVTVLLIGSFVNTPWRLMFFVATGGFLFSWIIAGGLSLF